MENLRALPARAHRLEALEAREQLAAGVGVELPGAVPVDSGVRRPRPELTPAVGSGQERLVGRLESWICCCDDGSEREGYKSLIALRCARHWPAGSIRAPWYLTMNGAVRRTRPKLAPIWQRSPKASLMAVLTMINEGRGKEQTTKEMLDACKKLVR